MTFARQRLGRAAEQLVADRLERCGWRVVGRNVRLPSGELDIVAMDGEPLSDIAALRRVEVVIKGGRIVKNTRAPGRR